MGQIILRGKRGSVYVEDNKAKVLKAAFEEGTLPPIIALDKVSFRSMEIKAIELEGEKEEKNNWKVNLEDYKNEHKRIRGLTAYEKSNRLEFFKLFFFTFTGKNEFSPELLEEARSRQEKFFIANPKRILPDPQIFKDLITDLPENKELSNNLRNSSSHFIERCLAADMREVKYA